MKMTIGKQKFPLAILQLNQGETAYIAAERRRPPISIGG